MLRTFTKLILKAKIGRDNASRQKKFLSWDKIENMALIIEEKDKVNKSQIDKFIDDTKKHVEVFYIETGSKHASFGDWHCFLKKDKSLLNLPAKKVEAELKSKKFDAVINTCGQNNFFAIALASTLPAYLKCAENPDFNLADLIITRTESFTLKNYLEETVRYLKMIHA